MHELSMTERLMQLALSKAQEAGARRILCIHVVVGGSAGLVPEIFSFFVEVP